jgi:hypothetical protein
MTVVEILRRAVVLVVLYAVVALATGGLLGASYHYNDLWLTIVLFVAGMRLLQARRWPLILPIFATLGLLHALVALAASRWMPFDSPPTAGAVLARGVGLALTYGLGLTWLGRRDARRRAQEGAAATDDGQRGAAL